MCLNAGAMGRIDAESETLIPTTGGVFDVAHTLRGCGFDASEDGTGRGVPILAFNHQSGGDFRPQPSVGVANGLMRSQLQAIATPWMVRRLTPEECERLQGFPNNYTALDHKGKPIADGPRYKMLGNSMAVNVMRWLGERIAAVEQVAG